MNLRRFIAALLIPIFTIWSVIFPSQVYANPLLIVGARVVAAAIKNPIGTQMALGTAVVAIGTLIQSLQISRQGTDGSTHEDEILMTNRARTPSAIESAAGMTSGFPHVVPPATSNGVIMYSSALMGTNKYASVSAMTSAMNAANAGGQSTWLYVTFTSGNATTGGTYTIYFSYNCGGATCYQGGTTGGAGIACDSGYTLVNSVCTLSSPDLVPRPSDGYCPIVKIAGVYAKDTTDPDCSISGDNIVYPDGSISISSADGGRITFARDALTGKRTIIFDQPDAATNTTKRRTITAVDGATDADPLSVTGVVDSVTQGIGDGNTGTAVAPSAPPVDMTATNAAIAANTAAIEAQSAADKAYRDGEAARDQARIGTAPPPDAINNQQHDLSTFSFNTYAFSGNSACPAPLVAHLSTGDITLNYQPLCDFLGWLRIGILSVALFSASLILLGQRSTDNA